MDTSTQSPDGEPKSCHVCGSQVNVVPSRPPSDAPCPKCGTLLWFDPVSPETTQLLADRGAFIETDQSGEVTTLRIVGAVYDDTCIAQLGALTEIQRLDIRETKITPLGAARLRDLLPDMVVIDT